MQPSGNFASSEQPEHTGHLRFRVHPHTAHNIMGGGPDLHRLLGNVKIGELHKLMIHARQLLFDMLRCVREFLLDP